MTTVASWIFIPHKTTIRIEIRWQTLKGRALRSALRLRQGFEEVVSILAPLHNKVMRFSTEIPSSDFFRPIFVASLVDKRVDEYSEKKIVSTCFVFGGIKRIISKVASYSPKQIFFILHAV